MNDAATAAAPVTYADVEAARGLSDVFDTNCEINNHFANDSLRRLYRAVNTLGRY